MPANLQTARTHLRLVSDTLPGIGRRRTGTMFHYTRANGAAVKDRATLDRIRKLAIPPAWTGVWIAADPRAHIQATGRDARGRKQYRYHTVFRTAQEAEKFGRLAAFARALPMIRAAVRRDLHGNVPSRDQVLALLVSLLESTCIRVGNEEYTRSNGSYGLTTLEDRHVTIEGDKIAFSFRGKGGKQRNVELRDRRLARLISRYRDIRGPQVFQYLDARGYRRQIHSADLNAYLARISNGSFTAKDFRTWGATLLAAGRLDHRVLADGASPGKRALIEDIAMVAEALGNTPAICRKSYIHPLLLEAYMHPDTWAEWQSTRRGRQLAGLDGAESRLLRFLRASTAAGRHPYPIGGRRVS